MSTILIIQSGHNKGRKLVLSKEFTRIGRKAGNQLVFGDQVVSGVHAEIVRKGDQYVLVDHRSTNGTFLNGKAVRKAPLHDGDRINLGKEGPLILFRSEEETSEPVLQPLSGVWAKGMAPISFVGAQITLGRGLDNDVIAGRSRGSVVSVRHAVIKAHADYYEIEDLNSSNGTHVNGRQVHRARLQDGDRVQLGTGGPVFVFRCGPELRKRERGSDMIEAGAGVGQQTVIRLQKAWKSYKRIRRLLLIVSVIAIAAILTGYYYYKNAREEAQRSNEWRKNAEEIFYNMRKIEAQVVQQPNVKATDALREYEEKYEQLLKTRGVYEGKSPVQQEIMRLARRLGEADLAIPPDFYQTVLTHIQVWQRNSSNLKATMNRAREQGIFQLILAALEQHGLPKEFIFIPLQESGYEKTSVNPQKTDYGFAKGMWQMIPDTAREYHLKLGPLKDNAQYDPSDERHDEYRSTEAAVQYLAELYSSKAAASGLLVIACYNCGSQWVIQKLSMLPNDPRQRNFWNFYRNDWIPAETRNYVLRIFSAALICENPKLFHVDMEPVIKE